MTGRRRYYYPAAKVIIEAATFPINQPAIVVVLFLHPYPPLHFSPSSLIFLLPLSFLFLFFSFFKVSQRFDFFFFFFFQSERTLCHALFLVYFSLLLFYLFIYFFFFRFTVTLYFWYIQIRYRFGFGTRQPRLFSLLLLYPSLVIREDACVYPAQRETAISRNTREITASFSRMYGIFHLCERTPPNSFSRTEQPTSECQA